VNEVIEQGGFVLIAVLFVSAVAWTLVAWKWSELRRQARGETRWADDVIARLRSGRVDDAVAIARSHPTALGRLIQLAIEEIQGDSAAVRRRLEPFIDAEAVALRHRLPLIGALTSTATLLGLLGTVIGMIDTFAALTRDASERVGFLAEGVSTALVTTEAGLVAALPLLIVQGALAERAEACIGTTALYLRRLETTLGRDSLSSRSASPRRVDDGGILDRRRRRD
jgi:biopolymer transport protein ExbB